MVMPPFHLAFPVSDLDATREFYVNDLGCEIGREDVKWIDFNFHGHQISAHLRPEEVTIAHTNSVDGDQVPVRHFGLVLQWDKWEALHKSLEAKGREFLIEPRTRFEGQAGEQGTFFLLDPSGNALEFKSFKNMDQLFARD
ncbi:VOC family protein [Curvivirga sp.]|uniref:VOC family protein n=1 Tax=Curvivirga sp. TaxID=2856848 RepID=UPI003B58B7A4